MPDENLCTVDLDKRLPLIIPIDKFELEVEDRGDSSLNRVPSRFFVILSVVAAAVLVFLTILLYMIPSGSLLVYFLWYFCLIVSCALRVSIVLSVLQMVWMCCLTESQESDLRSLRPFLRQLCFRSLAHFQTLSGLSKGFQPRLQRKSQR